MYYPTKKDARATGFLIPTYGVTSHPPQQISNAFFWAIDRSQDATFMHDWYSKTGQGAGAEYRYALSSGNADIEAYALHDNETQYDTGVLPGQTTYHIRGSGFQRWGGRLRSTFRIDYPTNIQTAQTFTTNIYDISRYQRTYGGNLIGSWRNYSLNATYERTEYFTNVTSSNLTGRSPRIAFSGSEQPIFGDSGLFAGFSTEYAHLDRQQRLNGTVVDDRGLNRLDLAPLIRYPFKKWQWLTVNTMVSWRETAYSRSLDPVTNTVVDQSLNRQVVTLQADAIGPTFNRVWDTPQNGYAEKFKHTIEPFVSFRRTSAFNDFDRIITLDSVDGIVGGTTTFTYGINNRIYAKRRIGEISQAQQILSVELSQSYYSQKLAAQYDPNYSTSFTQLSQPSLSNFSPILLSTRFTPSVRLSSSLRTEIDGHSMELRTLSADTAYNWASGVSGSIVGGWNQTFFIQSLPGFNDRNALRRSLTVASSVRTRENRLGTTYSLYFDAITLSPQQQTFSAYYNAQCCGIAMQYQRYNYGLGAAPIPFDRRFFISFSLAGLGTFSPFNGALGGLPR
jgi:LPS-assembly protein